LVSELVTWKNPFDHPREKILPTPTLAIETFPIKSSIDQEGKTTQLIHLRELL